MLLQPILLCALSWMRMTNFPTISLCPNLTTLPTISLCPNPTTLPTTSISPILMASPTILILPDSDSSHSGQIHFPLSDDEMDVVSDEPSAQPNAKSDTEIPMSVANTDSESDSIPDHIVLPCDPDVVPPTAESDTERPMSVANTDSES